MEIQNEMEMQNNGIAYVDNEITIPYQSKIYHFTKRLMDLVLCIPGLLIFAIAYGFLFIFYQFGENKGPVLYKQERIGQYGEKFYIYKFRSMVVDADKKLEANPELYQKYVDNSYKLELDEDPRITRLGKIIRKTSIDEFPQMLNVLKGEMSFVGPRPIIDSELEEYKKVGKEQLFTLMKPGITGLWQVKGRNNIPYPERCDVELEYLSYHSVIDDIKIICKTIINVIRHHGVM